MAIPTNQTAATALPMSLDYSLTLPDVDLATPLNNCDVWWSYTAQAGDNVIGFFAYDVGAVASYTPVTTVWTGPTSSLTQYLGIGATNVPVQLPVTPGTTYYFRVRNSSGVAPAAGTSVAVSALRGPAVTSPVGSILINDDTNEFPGAIISQTTGQPLAFIQGMAAGEAGDVLPTGEVLLEHVVDVDLKLYAPDLTLQAVVPYVWTGSPRIRAHQSGKWYVGMAGAGFGPNANVTTVLADGSFGPTTWDLGGVGLVGLAANAAETILYYAGIGGSTNVPIKRWDLVNDVGLSDLVAGIATYTNGDIIVLADDTIIAIYYVSPGTACQVLHYSAAGATLHTYTFGAIGGNTYPPRLATALDDPASFWIYFQDPTNDQIAYVQNVRISDGVILSSLTPSLYSAGTYLGVPTASPDRFGVSPSCPFMILREEVAGSDSPTPTSYTTVTHTRRRLRTFPHLSAEQVWAFHKSLQIDMETGVGVSDPDAQGYDPVVFLRWSDDGGHTWSNSHEKSLGLQGQYRHRIIYRQLGRSRDRIYELSMSDPVRANVIAGYLDAESGIA